jgi:dienelactone hydrolase
VVTSYVWGARLWYFVAGYPVSVLTTAGDAVPGYLHEARGVNAGSGGAILVAGAGGGVLGPAHCYPTLAARLAEAGVTSLRLDYRHPNRLNECLADVRGAIDHLRTHHGVVGGLAVVGWSFGGAVALQAGERWPEVRAVATVASQTAHIGPVDEIGRAGKPLLLLHGTGDTCLSDRCSRMIYAAATEPKELVLYPGDNHGITGNADSMTARLLAFITGAVGESRPTVSKAGPASVSQKSAAVPAAESVDPTHRTAASAQGCEKFGALEGTRAPPAGSTKGGSTTTSTGSAR